MSKSFTKREFNKCFDNVVFWIVCGAFLGGAVVTPLFFFEAWLHKEGNYTHISPIQNIAYSGLLVGCISLTREIIGCCLPRGDRESDLFSYEITESTAKAIGGDRAETHA